jgi:hypothetical protein
MVQLQEANVPATVILGMVERGNALRETPEVVAPPEGHADITLFYQALSPYGTWSQEPDVGWTWEPNEGVRDVNWRPYTNNGHWLWTDHGWYWESSSPYGWAVFHYGRWGYNARHRWCWAPDNIWGPAWVDWRESDDYIGWAPLPFGSRFEPSLGFSYQGRHLGFDFHIGLEEQRYTFVETNRFLDIDFRGHYAPEHNRHNVYNRTRIVKNTYIYNDNRIINNGISTEVIARATRRSIDKVIVEDAHIDAGRPIRSDRRKGNTIISYRPKINNIATTSPTVVAKRQIEAARHVASEPASRETAKELLKSERTANRKLEEMKEKASTDERKSRSTKHDTDPDATEVRNDATKDAVDYRSKQEVEKGIGDKTRAVRGGSEIKANSETTREGATEDRKAAANFKSAQEDEKAIEEKARTTKASTDAEANRDATRAKANDAAEQRKDTSERNASREAAREEIRKDRADEKGSADKKDGRDTSRVKANDAATGRNAAQGTESVPLGPDRAEEANGDKMGAKARDAHEQRNDANERNASHEAATEEITEGGTDEKVNAEEKASSDDKHSQARSAFGERKAANKEAFTDRKTMFESLKNSKREKTQDSKREGAHESKDDDSDKH